MSNNITITINKAKLQAIRNGGGKAAVRRALGNLASYGQGEMVKAMEGPRSGKTQGGHTASAPGEAPAVDTGNLKNSILAQPIGDGSKEWEIRVGAPYGIALEFGTEDIEPRPFARPAMEKTQGKVEEAFQAEFDQL